MVPNRPAVSDPQRVPAAAPAASNRNRASNPPPVTNVVNRTSNAAPIASNQHRASNPPPLAGGNSASNTMPAPAANSIAETAQDSTASENLTAAVNKFGKIANALGGVEQAKAFFEIYGTEGFKPQAKKERTLIRGENVELDSKIKDYKDKRIGLPARPDGYGAKFIADPAWDFKTVDKLSIASALTASEWKEIMESSKMLHGYVLTDTGVSRARFQAFQFKPKLNTPTDDRTDRHEFSPDCEVFDPSYIDIKETNRRIETAMAQNGFTAEAILASLSVSTPFAGGSASGSKATEQQRSQSNSNLADRKEFTATYNFPRARVFLDELNLEVTPECAAHLVKIRDAADKITSNINFKKNPNADSAVTKAGALIRQFLSRFGHIFTRTVLLGGQLTSTKSAASFAGTEDELARDSMQAAVALSFKSMFVSGSASYSKGTSDDLEKRALSVENSSALAWSANGGNTLLCANPAAWANSVAHYSTWRVIEQHNLEATPKLISFLTKQKNEEEKVWPSIDEIFSTILKNDLNAIPPTPSGTWTGKAIFTTKDNKYLALRNGVLLVSDSGPTAFQVLDADDEKLSSALPILPQLYSDTPIFLIPSDIKPERLNPGDGFPGLWVDPSSNDGTVRSSTTNFSRWSLRSARCLQGPNTAIPRQGWRPSTVILHDGDEVGLFNHSYWSGSIYRRTAWAPHFAPYAFKKPFDPTIRVWKMEPPSLRTFAEVGQLSESELVERIGRFPNWAFLKEGKSVSDLLVRADRSQPSMTTTPGSDVLQLDNLKNYYDPDFLEMQGKWHELRYDAHIRTDSSRNLSWTRFGMNKNTVGVSVAEPLTLADYDAGMKPYIKGMNLESLEPLRLKIVFVSF